MWRSIVHILIKGSMETDISRRLERLRREIQASSDKSATAQNSD
jgi:hypothetical protein